MFEGWERRTICHMAAAPPSLAFRDSDLQNWKQDHSLLLSLELSSPKPPSAVGRPHPDCPTWVRAHIPTAQNQTHQVNVHTGLPTVVSPTTDISCFRRSCMKPSIEGAKATPALKGSKSYALVMFHMVVREFIAIKAFSTSLWDTTPTFTPTITGCARVQQQTTESIKKYWGCSGRLLEHIQQYRVWTAHRNLELWLKSSKKCFPASFHFFLSWHESSPK